MEANSDKLFYTPDEFRRIIGCSRGLCYEALRERKIHSFKLGKKIFIPVTEIERLSQIAEDQAAPADNDDSFSV